MKGSVVVAIGVGRRSVGRDNGTRWQAEGSDFPNFASTEISEVAPAFVPLHTRLRCVTRRR